jgi:nicotinamide-nucleotide amidase
MEDVTPHVAAGATSRFRAAIVAVGSEMLTPSRVDTNSLFITEQLNRLGVDVTIKLVVGDDRAELAHAFRAVRSRVGLVVFSGGLGPTDDDLTREVVAEVLGRPLAEDPALTEALRARFLARGFAPPMPENNRRQAMVPRGATVIANAQGSAPGLWIEDSGTLTLLLPGPPRELKPMLATLMEGPLRERFAGTALVRRVLRIVGRIESQIDEALQPLYRRWERQRPPIAATILATLGQIELDLWVQTGTAEEADRLLDAAAAEAKAVIGDDVFTLHGEPLEQVVGDLLAQRGLRIALAESCTGGLIASRLTDVPGSSRYVMEGVVVYSNEAKRARLGVDARLIAEHGAVSEPVARAMASGIRDSAAVDIGLAVTGIAGPDGGTPEKPVGTVAIAVATRDGVRARTFRFNGDRQQVKFQASQAALDMVRRLPGAP